MLIFLHIPKTAGSTLNSILKRQYGRNGAIFHQTDWDPDAVALPFLQLPVKRQNRVQLFHGHFHFGVHERLTQPSEYFTLVRDPIERVISNYYYILNTPHHSMHHPLKSQKMTLADYVTSGISPEADNSQTRMLAGRAGLHAVTEFKKCDASLLAQAQENVERSFGVAGTMESFDAALLLLQRLYGWKTPLYMRENVTKDRPRQRDIPPETLATIAEYNQLDQALYTHMAQRFQEKIAGQGPAFAEALSQFQVANARYNQIRQLSRATLAPIRRTLRPVKRIWSAANSHGNIEALDKTTTKPVY